MSTVNHFGSSDQGRVRFKNEDYILSRYPEEEDVRRKKGSLFIVADGVGGHGAGDVASREACEDFVTTYYASPWRPDRAMKSAFGHANTKVFDIGVETNRLHMQTTFSAMVIVGSQVHVCHAGDTRIYRVRGSSKIELLTQDHSEVAELVKMNILSPEKVRNHPRRSIITRSLGSQPVVMPMFRTYDILVGDIFVMCTDGVWEPVEESQIASVAVTYPPDQACEKLIQMGLDGQSTDNLSVQVVRVLTVEDNDAAAVNTGGWWRRLFKRKKTEEATGSTLCN